MVALSGGVERQGPGIGQRIESFDVRYVRAGAKTSVDRIDRVRARFPALLDTVDNDRGVTGHGDVDRLLDLYRRALAERRQVGLRQGR